MAKINKVEDVDKAMGAKIVDPNSLVYYDPRNDDRFVIEGLAFFNENNKEFEIELVEKNPIGEIDYSHFKIKSVSFKEDKNATTIELESKGAYEWETTYQYDDYICDSNNPDVKYYLTYAKGTKEFTIGSKYTIKCTYGGYLTFKFEQIPSSVTKIDLYLGNDDNGNKDLIIKDIILQ